MSTNEGSIAQPVLNGKAISKPPLDNMGALNTKTPENQPQSITIDYIRFTLPYTLANFKSLASFVTGEGERQPHGMNGYTHGSAVLKTGRVLWSPDRTDMGIHVVLPATALAEIDLVALGLMNWVLDKGGHFTRIDVAFDDFAGTLDIEEIDRKLRAGEVVSRWKKAKTQTGSYVIGQGIDDGRGVTIGSRSSEAYCRIYDKKMEQEAKDKPVDIEHWVRCELELKGKKSQELAKILTEDTLRGNAAELLSNLLYGLLDFKDPSDDKNKSRWITSKWWLDFIQATGKMTVNLPKEKRTLDDVKEWWSKSIAPMTAVILLAEVGPEEDSGYDWIMNAIQEGEGRLKERHKKLMQGSLPIKT